MPDLKTVDEQTYKTDACGVVGQIRRSVQGLVMPCLRALPGLQRERIAALRAEDQALEIEQRRVVERAYAAAARLFTPEVEIDAIDIPRSAPYLALLSKGEQSDED